MVNLLEQWMQYLLKSFRGQCVCAEVGVRVSVAVTVLCGLWG